MSCLKYCRPSGQPHSIIDFYFDFESTRPWSVYWLLLWALSFFSVFSIYRHLVDFFLGHCQSTELDNTENLKQKILKEEQELKIAALQAWT